MANLAMSTVHALLGVIRKEAELLTGVRGDVQFIRDEMESINGLLRHLAGTKERASDHQVRAWIKQVMELAYDSNNCVERYARTRSRSRGRKGFLGHLRQAAGLPWAVAVRRRLVTRIRKLKVRAREVGERQQRYGVTIPLPPKMDGTAISDAHANMYRLLEYSSAPRETLGGDAYQRGAAIDSESGTDHMLKFGAGQDRSQVRRPRLSVVVINAHGAADGAILADKVYRHYKPEQLPSSDSPAPPSPFQYRLRVTIRHRPPILVEVLLDILRQLQSEGCVECMGDNVDAWDEARFTQMLQRCMRGKRFLLFFPNIDYLQIWCRIEELLASIDCGDGSAVVLSSKYKKVMRKVGRKKKDSKLPREIFSFSHVDFHHKKANLLLPKNYDAGKKVKKVLNKSVKDVLNKCDMDDYCTKLFLHALHHNPNRTTEELNILSESLSPARCSNAIDKRIRLAAFCYRCLPDQYKNCLWYTAAFVRGSYGVRRASLTRRWVAEGLITRSGQPTEHEEAERCVRKAKTCSVNTPVIDMVHGGRSIGTTFVDDFLDTNHLPLDLDLHFSIRTGTRIRQLDGSSSEPRPPPPKKQMESVMEFLRKLPSSSRLSLLRVLDLEGCEGFTKRHLNNICKIHKLKYLSLRRTEITRLPKQLHQLEQLETLDIRQTRVHAFESALPKSLKHLLAGRIDCPGEDAATIKSKESFSTVRMPGDVPAGNMDKLEILSHVRVYDSGKELANVGEKMKQLRKLGIVMCGGSRTNPENLFVQINELHGCLRSLSIRMEPVGSWSSNEPVIMRICGIRGWLPRRIKELGNLAKVTLRDTLLDEDALGVLGTLKGLRCLRLRYRSFFAGALTFVSGSFPFLTDLVVEDNMLTTFIFRLGASPKLANIVWSFKQMESLTGIKNLGSLKRIELNCLAENGVTNEYRPLQQEIKEHPNKPTLVCQLHNPSVDDQAVRAACAAS
uniref:Uncharacterized protein n=1 Tax=Oryza glumipatula TaxID=40148 RepID=A0A0D9YCA8_9ORYZ